METDTLEGIADLFLTVYPRFKHLLKAYPYQAGDEIGISQIIALTRLLDQPLTVGELAERLNVTRQGASLQAQSLVEHGWVRRIPDPEDRRSALLELSDEGRDHWSEGWRSRVDYLAAVFQQLTPDEIVAFQTTFLALQRVLDQSESTKD